jgi:hypothetical protein
MRLEDVTANHEAQPSSTNLISNVFKTLENAEQPQRQQSTEVM